MTAMREQSVGKPRDRVDGPAKVTGAAKYAAEFDASDLLYGVAVPSTISKGRIASIDIEAAGAVPGVIRIFTHANRPRTAWFTYKYRDEVAPPGSPFRPLYDDRIFFGGQPIALVVAETFEIATYAASLVKAEYVAETPLTDIEVAKNNAYEPKVARLGNEEAPARGDAEAALIASDVRVESGYMVAIEHHNPMELHASTVVYGEDGALTVYDKIQGVQNSQNYVTAVFGLAASKVRVLSPYVGGAFGSGLRPQYQLFLAVMAALDLERSVRVTLTRDQMFTHVYRPATLQTVSLGAAGDGRLRAVKHTAVAGTSHFEDYQENVVSWSGMLYHCDNAAFEYRIAQLDTATPGDMRAPGATLGVFALEAAMDELAEQAGVDPLALRFLNYAERDENQDKDFTSKELRACYEQGAERFGWSKRSREPRSMREGRELIGWGMATGVWEAQMMKASARATLTADGRLEVATATADIGTGTYTILAQLGADALGLPIDRVSVKLGDSSLPTSPVEGGSWAAASNGSAVHLACEAVRKHLGKLVRGMKDSPLAKVDDNDLVIVDDTVQHASDPSRSIKLSEVMHFGGSDKIEKEVTAKPGSAHKTHSPHTHSAIFAEVRVDEELSVIRVPRIVVAVAAGRILNPKTARSQIIGGAVFAHGQALTEETLTDHRLGRFMNRNLGEYHIPAHADIEDIDVIFVPEEDDKISPIGVKGLGEIGIVGTAAAISNAVWHATGKRVRDLPITIDKLL